MVGVRLFLIFVLCSLLFGAPAYGVRPLDDMEQAGEEDTLPPEIREEIEEFEKEKEALMRDISHLREGRKATLKPLVYEEAPLDTEPEPVYHYPIKSIAQSRDKKVSSQKEKTTSKPFPNLIFLSIIAIVCLTGYFFIRPKPEKN